MKPYEAIGLSGTQFRRRLKGAKRITKSEALACSHYLLGWATPVPAGDSAAFADWFYPRFGGTECIGEWLEVRPRALCDRLRGFEVRDGQRIKRGPETSLVRALDWVWRIGPACPYGAVKRAPAWPDQKTL